MSPDLPGSAAPSDTGSTATFGPGAEPVDERTLTPAHVTKQPPRRKLLDDPDPDAPRLPRRPRVRARKVRRIVRHIEPWSVLKISVLFFLSLFLILCVASAVLWNAARSAGAIDDIESFVTSLGFGNCEDIDGDPAAPANTTPSTVDGAGEQVGAAGGSTTTAVTEPEPESSTLPDEDGNCTEGQRLVGGFKFEDQRIFQAFALGGVVMVLAGAAASVVMVLLFNLISDLTGGVRVTVLEEEPLARPTVATGSPPDAPRD